MHPIQHHYVDAKKTFDAACLHRQTLLDAHDFDWHIARGTVDDALLSILDAAERTAGVETARTALRAATEALLAWGHAEALRCAPGADDRRLLDHLFTHVAPYSQEEGGLIQLILSYGGDHAVHA